MLIGGLAGIAVFEACSGVLMGAVLGLSSMAVSILFILPIPAAFFGAWFAGRPNKRFPTLMWQSVICCLLAGLMMWIPGLLGIMTVWTLLVPAALFFFGAGMLFPLATSGALEPFPFLAGTAGALVGGLQNIGSGVLAWLSAMMPQTGQGSLGLLMMLMGLLILLCWLPLASRFTHHQQPVSARRPFPGWRLTPYPGYRTGRLPARASAVPSFCRVAAHALPGLPNNTEG